MKFDVQVEGGNIEGRSFSTLEEAKYFVSKLKFRGCLYDNIEFSKEENGEIVCYGSFESPSLKNWDRIAAVISIDDCED